MLDYSSIQDALFGPFRLDMRRRILWRDGVLIPVRARSLDILRFLVAAKGDLVTKDELMAGVWPGQIVEENTIQVHVSAARKALGENDGGHRYIVTVEGRGYRFVGEAAQQRLATECGISPAIPDKPSIAVIPFQNIGNDPEQDYFADGMVEDIITALSRIRRLFVIARDSSFAFSAKNLDLKQVGGELGVRYVLRGSIRKSRNRIRITGQLIDVTNGFTLWADSFDGLLRNVFDLQDQVTAAVVGAITPQIERAEIERANRKPTGSLDAYDHCLRGLAKFYRETRDANAQALREFYRAIEIDPDCALAYGMAARCYARRVDNGWVKDWPREKSEAARLAWRAAELGKDDALALSCAGGALVRVLHEIEAGAELIGHAIELNSNLAYAWSMSSLTRIWLGEPELAIEHSAHGMRLSPRDPALYVMENAMGLAHFIAGRYDTAASWAKKAMRRQPQYQPAFRLLAASDAMAGRLVEAQAAIALARQLDPKLRISNLLERFPFRRAHDTARYVDGLRRAGLPE